MNPTEMLLQRDMTAEQRVMFRYELDKVRKNATTALILNLFGLHRFYLEQVGMGIAQWVLIPVLVGVVWIFVDLFRVQKMVEEYNDQKAREIAAIVRALASPAPQAIQGRGGQGVPATTHTFKGAPKASTLSPIKKLMVAVVVFLFLTVLFVKFVNQDSNTHALRDSLGRPAPAGATDDAGLLIGRCGPPSGDESSENDSPRPLIPSRVVEYQQYGLRAMFTPGDGTKVGDPPPYHWKLVGITDMQTEATVMPDEAAKRMPCWVGK